MDDGLRAPLRRQKICELLHDDYNYIVLQQLKIAIDKMVHLSTTVHAVTKLFTPMCLPCGGKNGLLIGTCLKISQF